MYIDLNALINQDLTDSRTFRGVIEEITKYCEYIRKQNQLARDAQESSYTITRIRNILFGLNKYNCISYARVISGFLSHSCPRVRDFASMAFRFVISMVVAVISSEKDPAKRKEFLKELSAIVGEVERMISGNLIPQDIRHVVSLALQEAHSILLDNKIGQKGDQENKNEENEARALAKIINYLMLCDENSCISCARGVIKYLTHSSPKVRQSAADALYVFVKIAVQALSYGVNPARMGEISSGLKEIATELSGMLKDGSVPPDISRKVEEALKIAKSGELGQKPAKSDHDEFVRTSTEDSIRRLAGDPDISISSLRHPLTDS